MSFYAYARAGDARYQERFGLDFEEFAVGQRLRHRPGVTLTQQDNLDEALDTINAAMLHYDANYAAQTTWKKPLMVSTITLQRVIGMASRTFGRKKSILSFAEIALTGPLFGGDTLYSESEITAVRDGGDDHGVVTVVSRGVTPEGREITKITYDVAVYKRGKHPDEAGGAAAPAAEEERFMLYSKLPDGTLVEHYGIFFEDARAGETFVHYPRRTFYRDEAVEHAWRSFEVNPQYHDQSWIAKHQDGKQRIQEPWLISAATAATTRTFGRVVANLGWTDIQLPTPVYAGDTTEAESTIVDKRESKSRPNEGILTVDTRAYNQRRELVLSYRRNLLVYRRTAETPYARAGYAPQPERTAAPAAAAPRPAVPAGAPDVGLARVLLFTPGNRPDRFAKAAATGADALILDLEDAVSAAGKDEARTILIEHFRAGHRRGLGPRQVCGLRVNNIHTAAGVRDLEALGSSGVKPDFIVLPKVETAAEAAMYARLLPGIALVPSIESARGLEAATEIANADPSVIALAFGGADLSVDLRAELAWEPLVYGRARVVQAAATAGIAVFDVPHVVLGDERGLREDAARAKAMGFTAKLAIHPNQVPPILQVFTPTAAEIERASGILAAYEAAGGNVVEYQGKMVEGPIVKAAQQVLARASSR
jgi:itaconyl-CoA hydratase